ncbi:MAG: PAS domain S-box protein, partial [Noviherbaspirillum sp.]
MADTYNAARLFESAFAHAATGMALVGLNGRCLQVNRALCGMLGYSEKELLGLSFQAIAHPRDLHRDLAQLNALLAGNVSSYQVEKRYFHKNGSMIWVQLNVSMVRKDDGRPDFFISQINNISARKQAEAERDVFFSLSVDMLSVAFTDGYLEKVNQASADALGWSAQELTEQPIIEFVHPDDREATLTEAELACGGTPSY